MIKFTEEELIYIMFEKGLYNNENECLFETVYQEVTDTDQEHASVQRDYVIKETATGKFYKASLGESPWIDQDRVNAQVEWTEVFPYQETVTKYK